MNICNFVFWFEEVICKLMLLLGNFAKVNNLAVSSNFCAYVIT